MTFDKRTEGDGRHGGIAADGRLARWRRGRVGWLVLATAVSALGGVVYTGIRARAAADGALARATWDAAVPVVSVIHPNATAPTDELILPGTVQGIADTPISARTAGYLKRRHVDIGDRVRRGQVLAEIDTPELDQQLLQERAALTQAQATLAQTRASLEQARATLQHNQATVRYNRTTLDRWRQLGDRELVAKQDVDDRQVAFEASRADEAAARANVDALEASVVAARANVTANEASVRRLEELQSFQKVSAPFDGIITARNTDVGALIDAAGTSSGKELFHLSAIGTLRVYVSLPQTYARVAQPGATASLTLDEFPGVSFHGKLVRTANAIDSASRTLLAEIAVENPAGQLLPGAYVSVHFTLPHSGGLTVPANTLLFRGEGLRVGLVRGGQVELVPVMIGRDFGSAIEVVSGLQPSDAVIVDPADSLVTGMAVRVRE